MAAVGGAAVFADLHCHSSASFDSLTRPADLVRVALERGLTHLAITDHGSLAGALAARDLAAEGLTVIVGEEVRSADGDVIGLYLETPVPGGLSALETIAAIHVQGGLAGIPHPFDRFRASGLARLAPERVQEILGQVDYIETWNARVPTAAINGRARDFALAHGLPGIAVSDAHSTFEVGVAYTRLVGPISDAAELKAALGAAVPVPGRASVLVRALTPWAKFVQWGRGRGRAAARASRP